MNGGGRWRAALFSVVVCGCKAPSDSDSIPLMIFGRSGHGPAEFNYPRAAAFGPDGQLYVVDKAGRLQRFSQGGLFEAEWRMPETDAGKPTGIGIAPDGRLFAADTHYSRVLIFDRSGVELGRFGRNGDAGGEFRLPTDVAVAADGRIYVSEYGGNDRVSIFDADLRFLSSFGGVDAGTARLMRPQSLLISADNSVVVADSCNHRVCRYTASGEWITAFGELGSGPGQLRFPYGVAELSDGSLVVAEYGNNRVQRFSRGGASLGVWGRAGRAAGQLAYPWTLATGGGGRVYVIDSGNNRVQVFDGLTEKAWRRD